MASYAVLALVAAVLAPASGCSAPSRAPASADGGTVAAITVFAAASLTTAFSGAADAVPRVRATFSFGGSQQMVTQLVQGARADVVATADDASMQRLVDARLVDQPHPLARTSLVIAVGRGNPKGVAALADLARPDVAVVLADPSVPAGRYARQVLDRAGVVIRPRSFELDVKATLAKVESGVADAAIVYATDVGPGGRATAVPFPEAADPAASVGYRIAVVSASRQRAAAEAFVASALGGPVHDTLMAAGFTA